MGTGKFSSNPTFCKAEFTFTLATNDLNNKLNFAGNTQLFTLLRQADSLALLGGTNEKVFSFNVKYETEDRSGGKKSVNADYSLTISNPCIDEAYVKITPPSDSDFPELSYTIFDDPKVFAPHGEFTATFTNLPVSNANLCGNI